MGSWSLLVMRGRGGNGGIPRIQVLNHTLVFFSIPPCFLPRHSSWIFLEFCLSAGFPRLTCFSNLEFRLSSESGRLPCVHLLNGFRTFLAVPHLLFSQIFFALWCLFCFYVYNVILVGNHKEAETRTLNSLCLIGASSLLYHLGQGSLCHSIFASTLSGVSSKFGSSGFDAFCSRRSCCSYCLDLLKVIKRLTPQNLFLIFIGSSWGAGVCCKIMKRK